MKIPDKRSLRSKDGRRVASYGRAPEGWGGRPIAYRLVRTARTRRGFGTIIHTITTFTPTKEKAAQSAAHWVNVTTKDR